MAGEGEPGIVLGGGGGGGGRPGEVGRKEGRRESRGVGR